MIEANIDDLSPQVLGYAIERLLEAGALDVSLQPVQMKKGRPGTLLRVIAKPEDREAHCADHLRGNLHAGRADLSRRAPRAGAHLIEVETPHGKVRIKVSSEGSFAPEYEDCRRLAAQTGVPLKQIIAEANYAYLKLTR